MASKSLCAASDKRCCEVTNDKIIVRKENRSKFIVENSSLTQVRVEHVDGCLIEKTANTRRCDWQFSYLNTRVLVELKGCDAGEAVEQIVVAAEELGYRYYLGEKVCYIVSSRSPASISSFQRAIIRLRKRYLAVGLALPKIQLEIGRVNI